MSKRIALELLVVAASIAFGVYGMTRSHPQPEAPAKVIKPFPIDFAEFVRQYWADPEGPLNEYGDGTHRLRLRGEIRGLGGMYGGPGTSISLHMPDLPVNVSPVFNFGDVDSAEALKLGDIVEVEGTIQVMWKHTGGTVMTIYSNDSQLLSRIEYIETGVELDVSGH